MLTPVIYEQNISGGFSIDAESGDLMRRFFIHDAIDESTALGLAYGAAASPYLGLIRQKLKCERLGGDAWVAEWEYGVADPQTTFEPGDDPSGGGAPGGGAAAAPGDGDPLLASFSFDTAGGTAHITQSLETMHQSAGAPDNKQAIGLTKDRIEGTDIHVPAFQWSRTVHRRNVKLPYLRALVDLTGTTNAGKFYGFGKLTVLYLGASGTPGQGLLWTITHKFAVQKKLFNIDVGGGIIVPEKDGWDYIWVAYKDEPNANVLMQVPRAAYVERVYEDKDFAALEIGV